MMWAAPAGAQRLRVFNLQLFKGNNSGFPVDGIITEAVVMITDQIQHSSKTTEDETETQQCHPVSYFGHVQASNDSRWFQLQTRRCCLHWLYKWPLKDFFCVFLPAAVEEVKLKDSQYTLEHMRAFGMYNYLHLDPWYEDSVLFVDCKGRVLSLTITLVSSVSSLLLMASLGCPFFLADFMFSVCS